eukprot:1195852-Prorocentrum_minimum.AAC.1
MSAWTTLRASTGLVRDLSSSGLGASGSSGLRFSGSSGRGLLFHRGASYHERLDEIARLAADGPLGRQHAVREHPPVHVVGAALPGRPEGRGALHHLVHHCAQRPQVRTRAVALARQHLVGAVYRSDAGVRVCAVALARQHLVDAAVILVQSEGREGRGGREPKGTPPERLARGRYPGMCKFRREGG